MKPSDNTPSTNASPGTVDPKAKYLWPERLEKTDPRFGFLRRGIRLHFGLFLNLVRKAKHHYDWVPIYTKPTSSVNQLAEFDELIDVLEDLFKDELGSPYTDAQRQLLLESHVIIIAVEKNTNSIAGYFSSSFASANSIPGVPIPFTFGCHGVIATAHQQFNLGVTFGALTMFHGHSIAGLFSKVGVLMRTNNRHVVGPLKQAGEIHRSDHLGVVDLEEEATWSKTAMAYMHKNLYRLPEEDLSFEEPMSIKHRFEDSVLLDGVASDQIVYVASVTNLAKAIFRLLARRPKRQHS